MITETKRPAILLSHHLCSSFRDLFECVGFDVTWAQDIYHLKELASARHIDIALEWQHGEMDFPVRDLLRALDKRPLLVLARNWRANGWQNIRCVQEAGYDMAIDVPFPVAELQKLKSQSRP